MNQIINPIDSYIGNASPANDVMFAPREELLGSKLWLSISKKHGFVTEDFDWLVEHCKNQRAALGGVSGFKARTCIIGEFLNQLMNRFGADQKTAATEWRALNEKSIHAAFERRHENEKINDVRFMESIIDSLMN